jgi:hypothetical protein
MPSPTTIYVTASSGSDPATWLAAIGTVAAVIVALGALVFQNRSFRQERDDRIQAEREASFLRKSEQARKVSTYTTGGDTAPIQLNVINVSDTMVTHVEAIAITDDYPGPGDSWKASFFPLDVVRIIPPGPSRTTGDQVDPPSSGLVFRHEIAFTDDNGVRWHKYGPEGLQEVPRDFTLLTSLQWDPSQRQNGP